MVDASRCLVEILAGKLVRRRKVNVQFRDALTRYVLDLTLLVVSQLDRQFVSRPGLLPVPLCSKSFQIR